MDSSKSKILAAEINKKNKNKIIKHFFSSRNNPMKIGTHDVDVFDLIILPRYKN